MKSQKSCPVRSLDNQKLLKNSHKQIGSYELYINCKPIVDSKVRKVNCKP